VFTALGIERVINLAREKIANKKQQARGFRTGRRQHDTRREDATYGYYHKAAREK
jgi:hypothetical protein